jgi:DNA recombination protein Rad52
VAFTKEQIEALSAPLSKANVATREQAGRTLSYIEGWHAEAEANRIFGFDGWSSEAVYEKCVSERERAIGRDKKPGWSVSYIAKVRVTVGGVVREGVGAGHGIDVDIGLAHESAIKEATTDAEKRALKTFGNPFGLALYDKTMANVEAEPSAADFAIRALIACTSADEFKATWNDNKANWRKVMSDAEYARVVAAMKNEAARFKSDDPFSEAA